MEFSQYLHNLLMLKFKYGVTIRLCDTDHEHIEYMKLLIIPFDIYSGY